MLKVCQRIAESVAETLWDNRVDLDRFLPALHQEMLARAKRAKDSADDYDAEELNYAANQEREAKLYLAGLGDAVAELECALVQSLPSDDQMIVGHMKSAAATLRNLKRRMDAA